MKLNSIEFNDISNNERYVFNLQIKELTLSGIN